MHLRRTLPGLVVAVGLCWPAPAPAQVYKNVSNETIERLLRELNIQYRKSYGKDNQGNEKQGIVFYDYTNKAGFKVRLHSYEGRDLWIDALFNDPMTLEDINRWNTRAKFSRCVQLNNNNKQTASLENQLDCLGGVTDAIVRQFVVRFDAEIRDFVEFVKNSQPR
jgi:hypothetical protein